MTTLFRLDPSAVAYWLLVSLVLLSVCVRPIVEELGLPRGLINGDSALVPVCAAAVLVLVVLRWRDQDRVVRLLTGSLVLLGISAAVSWLLGDVRNWAGFGLAYVFVLLAPSALFLAAHAARHLGGRSDVLVLRLIVLLQLLFGIVQYVADDVAQKAPFRADLVNGTTSHNFWPVFALPASLVLAILQPGARRWLWPGAVVVLSVYAEAKAALTVWVPLMVLVALVAWLTSEGFRRRRRESSWRSLPSLDSVVDVALAVFTAIIVGLGLWWSNSVKGTWSVFRGHTSDLANFVEKPGDPDPGIPTLKDALSQLGHLLPDSPKSFLFGLGPGNSVSHAAEVMAKGLGNGVTLPAPGPVARRLLSNEGFYQFKDAQSSVLGLWGDLGTVGALLYVAVVALAVAALVGNLRQARRAPELLVTIVLVMPGVYAGSVLLDWSEQGTAVIPLALTLVVAARALRSRAPVPR